MRIFDLKTRQLARMIPDVQAESEEWRRSCLSESVKNPFKFVKRERHIHYSCQLTKIDNPAKLPVLFVRWTGFVASHARDNTYLIHIHVIQLLTSLTTTQSNSQIH